MTLSSPALRRRRTEKSIDIPDDIIKVILSRSPVKSVVKFKSVSKSWQSIISDPRFTRTYRMHRSKVRENENKFLIWSRNLPQNADMSACYTVYLMGLEAGEFQTESVFPYQFEEAVFPVTPISFCDGLILLKGVSSHHYMLWNPSIRKHIMISGPDPTLDLELCQIYHDSTTDDYKIVFVYKDCYTVYSCKSESWGKMIDLPCHVSHIYGASVDGCFYGRCNDEIVCFDARQGELQKFPHPKHVGFLGVTLQAVCGRVCVLSKRRQRLELWVMEKNGSFEKRCCWRKLISMEKNDEAFLWYDQPTDLVCLSQEDEVVFMTTNFEGLKHYFIYNSRQNGFRQMTDFTHQNVSSLLHYFPYSENLYMSSSNICQ